MNIRPFTRDDFERLIESEGGPHVSLFVPPPSAAIDTVNEDKIRFDNFLRSVHKSLTDHWMTETESREFMKPLQLLSKKLLQLNPRKHSVAIFTCNQSCDLYRVDHRLIEQLSVDRTFRVRPLLPSLDEPSNYMLLTLSQHRVALFHCTDGALERVMDIMPDSFEAFEAELTVEPQTQVRATAVGGRHRQGIVFHGQRDLRDAEKVDLENYLKRVDHTVCAHLSKHPRTRLILAGVDSLTSMYRAISHGNDIAEARLSGNVDHLSVEELQGRVEQLFPDELHKHRRQKAIGIREHCVPVVTDPEQVLIAASDGRIDCLFVDQDATLYGFFLPDQRTLKEVHHAPSGAPGDSSHDLIEQAAVQTIKTGGSVYAVPASEMPIAKRMVAGLRFGGPST
ncbi:MAG: hypothetical protein SFV81_25145 [Pirellulaceae bacterium]|nr:hypothetical protein [Pirellulaceae bacterium]